MASQAPRGLVPAMLSVPWTRALLYLVVGGALVLNLVVAGVHTWQARRAQAWVEVAGEVVRSRVDDRHERPLPVLVVRYAHAGHRGEVTLIPARGVEGAEDLDARALTQRYPVGASIPVFVDPDAPEQATLSRRFDLGPNLGGTAILLIALGLVIRTDRRLRRG